jgi:hypothetical protein
VSQEDQIYMIHMPAGANGLPGLGIEPIVGRRKSAAVFFFSPFSFGQAKEKG